ncbi:TlpA disulfide reductase family protein [Porticoccus sp. W117]|uniref:TlpA family protein disulfide reductase n=1 Tax=Porticoccus sp. W117 TaxID=3054777 RepID=UPI002594AAC7|nr:TlpA disulfide reductase family protein [Porticoccus sp. W117]MDM3871718.1 TlpA disulfide reductase family protein [Porticoccus sp. W117]
MKKLLAPLFAVALLLPVVANAEPIEFSFPDREGEVHNLSDHKGRYVLVDFWASWCVPCRKQTPHLKKFEQENHYDNLVVMGISMDDDVDAWVDALDEDQPLGLQLICEDNFDDDLAVKLDIYGIPRFVLFGPSGEVVDGELPQPSDDNFKSTVEKHVGAAH